MEALKQNKVFWVLVIITAFNITLLGAGTLLIDKIADRVIKKLKADYSPSPYGPGIDPDKVNPDVFKTNKADLKNRDAKPVKIETSWREEFERERGVTP